MLSLCQLDSNKNKIKNQTQFIISGILHGLNHGWGGPKQSSGHTSASAGLWAPGSKKSFAHLTALMAKRECTNSDE